MLLPVVVEAISHKRFNMKLFILFALIFVCEVFGDCPSPDDVECVGFDYYQSCAQRKQTVLYVDGQECTGCMVCFPDLAEDEECPNAHDLQCPFDNNIYGGPLRQDCGIAVHAMTMKLEHGKDCYACNVAVYDCTPWWVIPATFEPPPPLGPRVPASPPSPTSPPSPPSPPSPWFSIGRPRPPQPPSPPSPPRW